MYKGVCTLGKRNLSHGTGHEFVFSCPGIGLKCIDMPFTMKLRLCRLITGLVLTLMMNMN